MENERNRLSIAIVYSESDYGNADLSGTPESLRQVRQFMMEFIQSDRVEAIISTLDVDPAPYDRCLNFLSIRRDSGTVKLSVVENSLQIVGDTRRLLTFANWFDFSDDTPDWYHCHHDGLCGDEWVDPQSLPLVIGIRTK
jgi:hypothetical protein